jgi:hypothetical protein
MRVVLGLYLVQFTRIVEAKKAIDPVIDMAVRLNYKRRLCHIYVILGSYYFLVEEDYEKSFNNLNNSLKLSEEIPDLLGLFMGSWLFGVALGWSCEFEMASNYFHKALEINMAKNLWGTAVIKVNIANVVSMLPEKSILDSKRHRRPYVSLKRVEI